MGSDGMRLKKRGLYSTIPVLTPDPESQKQLQAQGNTTLLKKMLSGPPLSSKDKGGKAAAVSKKMLLNPRCFQDTLSSKP